MIFLSVLQNGKEKRFIIFPGGKNMKAEIIRQLNVFKERGMKPNYSALAAENNMDRRTVKKYFANPQYQRKAREYHSRLEQYDEIIRTKCKIPGMTFAAVYSYLKNEKGMKDISYNALTDYCRKKKYRTGTADSEPHPRFNTPPGHQVQVDWKEDMKLVTKSGKEIEFNVYSATLGFSRKHFFIYSATKTEQDFIRCTNELLKRMGGAPVEILTDNMSAIVSISGSGERRRKHPNIMQWEKDAVIRIRLCKPHSPETKGKDESANRFLARLLAYNGEVESVDDVIRAIKTIQNDANDKVNPETGMPPESLFQAKEKQAMGPLPNMSLLDSYFDGGMAHKVPNTMLVPFLGKQYSVPAEYIGKNVRVLRNSDTVEIYYNGILVSSHEYDEEKKINYTKEHYVQGLTMKMADKQDEMEKLAERNLALFGEKL